MPCCIGVPTEVNKWDALGYISKTEDAYRDDRANKIAGRWRVGANVMNAVGYILNPIIGLVRMVVAAIFLARGKDAVGRDLTPEAKGYLKAQIARGAFETVGGGLVLWIADLARHYGCLKEKGETPVASRTSDVEMEPLDAGARV